MRGMGRPPGHKQIGFARTQYRSRALCRRLAGRVAGSVARHRAQRRDRPCGRRILGRWGSIGSSSAGTALASDRSAGGRGRRHDLGRHDDQCRRSDRHCPGCARGEAALRHLIHCRDGRAPADRRRSSRSDPGCRRGDRRQSGLFHDQLCTSRSFPRRARRRLSLDRTHRRPARECIAAEPCGTR
jgi:hypothetical protein